MSYSSLNIPDWATHTAINHDGTIYAFSGKPGIFPIPTGDTEGDTIDVWEPEDENDCYQRIGNTHPDLFWRESMQEVRNEKQE